MVLTLFGLEYDPDALFAALFVWLNEATPKEHAGSAFRVEVGSLSEENCILLCCT